MSRSKTVVRLLSVASLTAVRLLSVASLVLLSSACRDDRREVLAPTDVTKPETSVGPIAFLTISDSAPKAGTTVIVSAHAVGQNVTFGSFAGHLTFNSGLVFLGETGNLAGMRAVNAKPGDVAIAGVNLEGFAEGKLFAVSLRVDDPAAVSSLALTMTELTGLDYKNQRPALSVQKAVRFARAR